MRYVTRCPACLAMFEVREAQRHAAQGWLRCGQCFTAFDSAGLLMPWPQRATPLAAEPGRIDIDSLLYQPDVPQQPLPVPAMPPAAEGHVRPPAAPQAPSGRAVPIGSGVDTRTAQSCALGWSGASLLALALLGLQGLYAARGTLAMQTPLVERWGQDVCRWIGCAWPPLQLAQALHLDSARLVREEDQFVLFLRLRNLSQATVSSGSIAVRLQDAGGQPLVRRVLPLTVLGGPERLQPGAFWEGRAQLMLSGPSEIAGFQVNVLSP